MNDKKVDIIFELQAAGYDDDDCCISLSFSSSLPHTLPVPIAKTMIYRALGQLLGNTNDVDVSFVRNFAVEAYCFSCFCRMGFDDSMIDNLAEEPIQITIPLP